MKTKMLTDSKIRRIAKMSNYPDITLLVTYFLKRWYQQIGDEKYHNPYYYIDRCKCSRLVPRLDNVLEKVNKDFMEHETVFDGE